MAYVYDSSFAGAIIIPDERNPKIDVMRSVIRKDDDIFVPQLFWYEISNIFYNLIRRKRYTDERIWQFFPFLEALRLTTDNESGIDYAEKLLRLCTDYNLRSYDAAYLELAERKHAVLCTLDEGLRTAAKKRGVAVLK